MGNIMKTRNLSGRGLKDHVFRLLKSPDFNLSVKELSRIPSRRAVNPLFSFLYNSDEQIRWRAITAMGAVVSNLADEDMDSARVIMRRLMWNLNDESGGIGWGSPEAMGEILANSDALAKEYARILISYARTDGNFQEHELMQRGVLWAIGRLSQVRPDLTKDAAHFLIPYLESRDPGVRGLAAWVLGLLGVKEARPFLERLRDDEAQVQVFLGHRLVESRVKKLAEQALAGMVK